MSVEPLSDFADPRLAAFRSLSDATALRERGCFIAEGRLVVRRRGYHPDKVLALTFDDGPDAEWTPQVLDELKREKVPATFFVIGENAERCPDLVRRMEQGQASLDEALALWERGEELYTFCRAKLDAAQGKVEELASRLPVTPPATPSA